MQTASAREVAAVRVTEASIRVAQDATFRAEWIERRAQVAEEAGWSIATAAATALAAPASPRRRPFRRRMRTATSGPRSPKPNRSRWSRCASPDPAAAIADVERTRVLAPLMEEVRRRRPSTRSVSLWTATGALRMSPWIDIHRANRDSGGELERFVFNRVARFPEARPAGGDRARWVEGHAGPNVSADARFSTLFVPVRDRSGRLLAGIAIEVDASRYVAEAMENWQPAGRFLVRHRFRRPCRLHDATRRGDPRLERGGRRAALHRAIRPSSSSSRRAAARADRSSEEYLVDGKRVRIASARAGTTGWVFYEGISREALDTIRGEAAGLVPVLPLDAAA